MESVPNPLDDIVMGTYAVHENEPAMVAFEFGSGKVLLVNKLG